MGINVWNSPEPINPWAAVAWYQAGPQAHSAWGWLWAKEELERWERESEQC